MNSWETLIDGESKKSYYAEQLIPFVEREYASCTVYPDRMNIFRAFELTPIHAV